MDEKTEIIIEPGQPTITLKRVFGAPRDLVFEAWTKAEHVKCWYDPGSFTLSGCEIDFRVGGKWRVFLHAPNGQDHGLTGEYREIVAPERLVHAFHYDGAQNAEATETLVFEEEDGKTILTSTVVHTSVENRDRHVRSGLEQAATQILEGLADHLQSRDSENPDVGNKEHVAIHEQAPEIPQGAGRRTQWDWRIAAGVLAVMIFGDGSLYWSLPRGGAARYVTEIVDRGSVIRTVGATGVVNPRSSTQIGASVSGKIEALYCGRDVKVKAGQLCAKIDPRPFQSVIDREKAGLMTMEAQLKKDEIRLGRAKEVFERTQVLANRRVISQTALANARSAYEKAEARAKLDEAAIRKTRDSLRAAEIDLARTDVISPIDGTVVSRNIEVGQIIEPGGETPLFVLTPDLSAILVDAKTSASDVGEIKLGAPASFTIDTFPNRVFTGEVKQISQSPQMAQGIVISAVDPGVSITPGAKTMVQIEVDRRDDVIRVPNRSLLYSARRIDAGNRTLEAPAPGWARLWVLRNGKPTAINVRLGLDDGAHTEVIEGDLQPGDQLIVG